MVDSPASVHHKLAPSLAAALWSTESSHLEGTYARSFSDYNKYQYGTYTYITCYCSQSPL